MSEEILKWYYANPTPPYRVERYEMRNKEAPYYTGRRLIVKDAKEFVVVRWWMPRFSKKKEKILLQLCEVKYGK